MGARTYRELVVFQRAAERRRQVLALLANPKARGGPRPRKRKNEPRDAEMLAPVPVQVLDQFVGEGPLTAAEVEAATRRWASWRTAPAISSACGLSRPKAGCHDILIAVTDGLKGMSEAIDAVYPATARQTCLAGPPDAAKSRPRELERAQAAGRRPAADLHAPLRPTRRPRR